MLNEQQFESKWKEIKGGLRNLWGKLTDDELEQYKGNIYEVSSLVEEKYNDSKDEIREKLHQLMDSFDNDTDKNIDPDVSSYMRSPLIEKDNFMTSEKSQLADADHGERSPEEVSFSEKTYAKAHEEIEEPQKHSNYSGANPGRDGFGPDFYKKEKQDFDSDRNARH